MADRGLSLRGGTGYSAPHWNLELGTVGPVTRTADILTQSIIWRLGLYPSLIGFNPRRLKVLKRGWAPTQRT